MQDITYYKQPTANSCGQTAVAMLLSAYGINRTPQQVIAEIPTHMYPETGEPWGTLVTDFGIYLTKLGFKTHLYSYDVWVTDMSWIGKEESFIADRLTAIKDKLEVPSMGKVSTQQYIQGYLDFIAAGCKLSIAKRPDLTLMQDSLKQGPFLACVCYQSLYGKSKVKFLEDGINTQNDDAGRPTNHTIVVADYKDNKFLLYDPRHPDKTPWVDELDLISAIMAAQIECDNQILFATKK